MSDDLHTKALQLELRKRYAEAAECWETAGQIEKAIANYQRGGHVKRAIDLALQKGMRRRAAELYLKAEIYDRAGELFHKERDYASAARAYRQGGSIVEAANMFELAGEFCESAKLHESVNDFMKAGELYERGQDIANSARVYELAIDANTLDQLGGKKDMARVAQILTKVKNFEKAAEIYLQSQEICEAILMFVRVGEIEGAARLLANCQGDVGFEVLAHINHGEKNAIDFAKMFYLAKDYGKAARVFEGCGEPARAAFLYEKDQDYHKAAEQYAQVPDVAKAAEMFEKAASYKDAGDFYIRSSDPGRAAVCYEAAEDFYLAGKLYFETERFDKAIDLLQKIDESGARHLDATVLIAEILRRKGHLDLAVDRYRKILSGAQPDAQSIEHFYNLGCIMLEKRDFAEAERRFAQVVKFKFGYRDAAALLEQARRSLSAAAVPRPAATAAAAPAQASSEPADARPAVMVGRMDGFEVLAGTTLFEELSLAEAKRFWDICELHSAERGDVVLDEGVEGAGLHVIRRGAVNVVKSEEILVQLHPGDFFGEMSLIDVEAKTSARVVAASDDVEIFLLGREAFLRLLQANDHTALKLYRVFVNTLCSRLRKANEELAQARSR